MTSNQLAFASNQIDQQVADETKRHNVKVEDENVRHNTRTEELTDVANSIKQFEAEETKRHNEKLESLQQEYNRVYLELQKAQGDERNRIQAQLANIEADKAAEISRHNIENEAISNRINQLNEWSNAETVRHNEAVETNALRLTELESRKTNVQEKMAIAQNMYWNGVLANEQLRMSQQHYIGLANAAIDMYGLQQKMLEWKTNKKQVESQVWKNYVTGATTLMEGIAKSITSSLGVLQLVK